MAVRAADVLVEPAQGYVVSEPWSNSGTDRSGTQLVVAWHLAGQIERAVRIPRAARGLLGAAKHRS
ncbi:MAG: hypothetical protein R2724_00595 [Bryobacterales bacterium]